MGSLAGNLLATKEGDLVYLDFGMMSTAPEYARYAIIAHVVHLGARLPLLARHWLSAASLQPVAA